MMGVINDIWVEVGFVRWPMAVSVLAIAVLAAWSAAKLLRPGAVADHPTKAWLDAILFWGGLAVLSGVLGTLSGFTVAAQAVEAAGAMSPTIFWGGIKVAMLGSLFGMLILAGASLAWFVLQLRWRLLVAKELEAAI